MGTLIPNIKHRVLAVKVLAPSEGGAHLNYILPNENLCFRLMSSNTVEKKKLNNLGYLLKEETKDCF